MEENVRVAKSGLKGVLIPVILIVIAFVVFNSCTYSVRENEYGLVKQFGKIVNIQTSPGLHFRIPFIHEVSSVYAGDRVYDIPASDVITKDKKSMIADLYVIWDVVDVTKYYQTLNAVSGRAEERIDAAVYNATKNIISSKSQDETLAARGDTLTNMITDESNSDMAEYGIEIKIAEIKVLDLPNDNKNSVYERMISERQNIAAGYTAQGNADAQKIRNETDKKVAVTIAEANKIAAQTIADGEAEYMKILSEAYNDEDKAEFYNFVRSLDALKQSLTGDKTLILDKDSELVQILYGK